MLLSETTSHRHRSILKVPDWDWRKNSKNVWKCMARKVELWVLVLGSGLWEEFRVIKYSSFHFSIKWNCISFGFALLHSVIGQQKLAPLSQPMRSNTKTIANFSMPYAGICNYFKFQLTHSTVCICFDWFEEFLWFWFCDTQLKSVLFGMWLVLVLVLGPRWDYA